MEFLDEYYRTYMRYSFEDAQPGQLFLYKIDFWRYTHGDEQARNYQHYHLKASYTFSPQDGLVVYTNTQLSDGKWAEEIQQAAHPLNLTRNWEPYPDWRKKNYEGLVKLQCLQEGDFLLGIQMIE